MKLCQNTHAQALSSPLSTSQPIPRRQYSHPPLRRITRLSIALCLLLTLHPSGPVSISSTTSTYLSPIPLCFAAPAPVPAAAPVLVNRELAFWTPITDAFNTAKDAISSIFHKSSSPSSSPDTSPAIEATTVTTTMKEEDIVPLEEDEDVEKEGVKRVRVVASVDDYGVAHLDLEGDPNCDYTTKVRIAGSEYNVIIDTGSAHFAVASNACKDCIIQRKDHFRLNEEEEIPIDADVDITAAAVGGLSGDQMPLNLLKEQPNKGREGSLSSEANSSTTTTATTTATAVTGGTTTTRTGQSSAAVSSVSSLSSSSSHSTASPFPALSTSIAAAATTTSSGSAMTIYTAMSTSTSTSVAQHPLTSSITPPLSVAAGAQGALHVGANVRFHDNLERLKKMQADVDAVAAAAAVVHAYRPIVPAGRQGSGVGNRQSPLSTTSEKSHKKRRLGGGEGQRRTLVAAPAENLYPLSNNAREQGESIRVSYGIKSHSVGWSGVMTSDLMTLDMTKVKSGNSNNINSNNNITTSSAATATTVDAPGTLHLEDGGSMEKETNVGFAAIIENTGFFSQECGAQHGIWGLGYRSLSVDHKPTLFDTLSASMRIPNGFALQLCGRVGNTTKSGNMFLGGYSTSHLAEPMQFVPLVQRDWYQVQLDGFKVMGQPVQGMANLNLPKTIVDSGTTNILMSHYNLQFLIDALSRSEVVQWSSLIPEQDISNFWFRNAVLRLPRSSFRVATKARAVEVVISGVAVPIYTASFLRIKPVPLGQAPDGYVDFWWHGFASSTAPEAVEAERATGGAVLPGSVGTILGETLFSGKVVYFERGNEDTAQNPGDKDFGRIGFARGRNCFAPADHRNVDVMASGGQVAVVDLESMGPVRVSATSDASGIRLGGSSSGGGGLDVLAASAGGRSGGGGKKGAGKEGAQPDEVGEEGISIPIHISALDTPIRLMGGGATGVPRPWSASCSGSSLGLLRNFVAGLAVAYLASAL